MKAIIKLISSLCFVIFLSGCAQHTLKAPCPNYGKWCSKTSVNSWDQNE